MTNIKQRCLPYAEQIQDPKWQVFRSALIAKAGGMCEDCRKPKVEWLTVHHCYYLSGLPIWDHPVELCRVLCWDCHQRRQRVEEAAHVAMARALRNEPVDLLERIAWRLLESAVYHERKLE